MFQFRRFPTTCYFIHKRLTEYCSAGFPHSDIHGSRAAFASPWLFVDRYVLHRLPMPRHSPCALISLTFFRIMCPIGFLLISSTFYCSKNFTLNSCLDFLNIFGYIISLFPFHITCIQFSKYILHKTSRSMWWARVDSNHRPHAYQACALTTWATSPFICGSVGSYPLEPFFI